MTQRVKIKSVCPWRLATYFEIETSIRFTARNIISREIMYDIIDERFDMRPKRPMIIRAEENER